MPHHRGGPRRSFRRGIPSVRGHGWRVRHAPVAHRGRHPAPVVGNPRAVRGAAQRLRALLRSELAIAGQPGHGHAGAVIADGARFLSAGTRDALRAGANACPRFRHLRRRKPVRRVDRP
ncbi:protein of unknown function [Burkholderia multivorans]